MHILYVHYAILLLSNLNSSTDSVTSDKRYRLIFNNMMNTFHSNVCQLIFCNNIITICALFHYQLHVT